MASRREYMEECAETYLNQDNKAAHDAIMAAIDDEYEARQNFPSQTTAINEAVSYAKCEMRGSGFG